MYMNFNCCIGYMNIVSKNDIEIIFLKSKAVKCMKIPDFDL